METVSRKRLDIMVILTLSLLTAAIYAQTAYFPFNVLDDADYVSQNSHVLSGLTLESLKWAFTAFYSGNWHPLTWLSLMMDTQLFGRDPMGYHIVNVVLHSTNAALLFFLFRYMTGALWRSAFLAALFALHPLHVESVAWITERKDVLSALFWMLTLLCYTAYARSSKKSMYILSLGSYALGLMAKPMLVTLPAVLLILDFWPLGRLALPLTTGDGTDLNKVQNTTLLLEKIPFLLLSVASAVVTLYAQAITIASFTYLPFYMRVANALRTIFVYVRKMLFPYDLAFFYNYVPIPLWEAGCLAAVLCGILWIVAKKTARYPYVTTGLLWYLVTLLPVIGLVQVGRQSMADRYTYIPLIGIFIVMSWGGAELCAQVPSLRKAAGPAAVILILLSTLATWNQLSYWHDNVSLLSHAINVTHDNDIAHIGLGISYEQQGNTALAIQHYRQALEIKPDDSESQVKMGMALDRQGKSLEAVNHLAEAIRLDPDFSQAHFSMATIMDRLGRTREAIQEYRVTLKLEPENAECHNNLGAVLARQGELDEAIQHFTKAVQLNPGLEKAKNNLRVARQQMSTMRGE